MTYTDSLFDFDTAHNILTFYESFMCENRLLGRKKIALNV